MAARILRTLAHLLILSVCGWIASCGGAGFNNVSIAIAPTSTTLDAGIQQQFQATVTGSSNTSVTWQVNNITGGNAQVGTITASGLYTAPNPGDLTIQVTVTAVANVNPAKTASAQVTVNPGIMPLGS